MSLVFLQPLYLLGMLAAAIPVVIHLMERRREMTLTIPTVRFIIEAHRRRSRRLAVRRWLLLAARVIVVLLLAAALARPVIQRPRSLLDAALPGSTVIILDDSPSMAYERIAGTRWDRAGILASGLVARLTAQGEAAVLATSRPNDALGFSRDGRALAARIEAWPLSGRPADLAAAFNAAYRLLDKASLNTKQIVFLTDFSRPDWQAFKPDQLARPDLSVPIRMVDLSGGAGAWNRAVEQVSVTAGKGEAGAGRVRVTLTGWGPVPAQPVSLGLELDGKMVSRRLLDNPAPGEQSYDFVLPRLERGSHQLSAVLDEDPLPFDDRCHAVVDYGGRIKVLTVDGSPQASLINSETFFLRAALVPDRLSEERVVDNTVVFPAQLQPGGLSVYDVIILANLRSLDAGLAEPLAAWVGGGGGLIVFLGDNFQRAAYQSSFDASGADLLPYFPGDPAAPPSPGALEYADHDAYPLSVFRKPGSGDLTRARFSRFVPPGGGGLKPGAKTLLAFDPRGEKPFLIDRPAGKGRVLLFTSSADLDWNNLPAQSVYLPLLQRCLEYLAGDRGLAQRTSFEVGESPWVTVPEEARGAAVYAATPAGERLAARVERSTEGERAVAGAAELAGFYQFFAGTRELPAAVNASRRESDVRRVADEALAAAAAILPLETVEMEEKDLAGEGLRGTIDATPWLFGAILALLLAEGIISVGLGWKRKRGQA